MSSFDEVAESVRRAVEDVQRRVADIPDAEEFDRQLLAQLGWSAWADQAGLEDVPEVIRSHGETPDFQALAAEVYAAVLRGLAVARERMSEPDI